MAGLNSLLSNTSQQTTSMPAWYDTAQQNIVSGAQQAYQNAPQPGATVGQQAVNLLGAPNNAFNTASNSLQSIASGAASPWITDAAGNVTPNTSTALGGLFQAQDQQLKQLLPNVAAAPTAASIGSGQFGSLRGQTATDKAMADAAAQLRTQQMQAALQNQQTGVSAATGAGNLTNQQIQDLLTVGQYQQASPYTNVANLGKVVGSVQAPTMVSNQTQLSPLNQIGAITSLLGGSTTNNLLGALGIKGGFSGLSNIFSGNPSANSDIVNNYLDTAANQGYVNPWNDANYEVPNIDTSGITSSITDQNIADVTSGLSGFFG